MLQRYRINNCADIAEDGGGYCLSEDVAELEKSKWVSVVDELPNVRCIAYMPNPDKSLEYRFIPEGLFKQVATEATHWQPLPPPPQQPTGKG